MAKKSWIAKWKREPKFETRRYNRCHVCGRSRGYLKKFGTCRICFRKLAHQAILPGVRKSSW